KGDWKSAIAEMEKLFALEKDPIIRVRIGDAHQKLNQKAEAVKEYVKAADLYAENGFVVKALAQYKLALRVDPNHRQALDKMAGLHTNKSVSELKLEPVEIGDVAPTSSVIPLFADLTQDEFNEFTKRMVVHNNISAGKAIIKEGEAGASVYVMTRGAVSVYTSAGGKRVDLAILQPSDFFGEIAFLTGKPRTATVETTEESDFLEVPEEELRELMFQRPRIKEVLQRYYEQRAQSTIEKIKGAI
ncbi:MAG TPA: cyclic nucleotide-binding domain-containing protein, partial [Nitrospirota bacterium]|nr:cyclic nucleotide-binding domain-containing protein [Nitrospirota bacterium]